MKRVVIAILLLLIVTVGSVLTLSAQQQTLSSLANLAGTAESRYVAGDTGGALAAVDELNTAYAHHRRWLAMVFSHTALAEAEKSVVSLPLILRTGEPLDFAAEARRCRLLLNRLWQQERPVPENLL